jgi:hypothetical protein
VGEPSQEPFVSVPGDLIFDDYQYEFRGFLFGAHTSYVTEKVSGLLGMPAVRDMDIDSGADHGSHPGLLLLSKRIIQFDMKIVGSTLDINQKLGLARTAFQVPRKRYSRVLDAFVYKRPGEPKKVLYARCTKRDFVSDYDTAHGLSTGSVELTAPYPVISGLDLLSQSWNLAAGSTNGQQTITNEGDFADGARPKITLTGPWTNPRIQNVTDYGRTIRFDLVLNAGDTLIFDAATMSAQISRAGGAFADAYQYVRADNQWWNVLPGPNVILATRTNNGAQGTIKVEWQDAYS